jgi:hypothetical protein
MGQDGVIFRPRLRYLVLFLSLGLVASDVSVNVLTSYSYSPSGVAITNYGFPLPWETVSGTLCGQSPPQPYQAYSILNGPCLASCCVTTYNLAFLLFDVLFYVGIGYLSLLSYHKLMRGIDRRASELVSSVQSEPEESPNVENEDQSGY